MQKKNDCKKAQSDRKLAICARQAEQQSYQEMEAVYQQLEKKYQSEKDEKYRDKQWRSLKLSQYQERRTCLENNSLGIAL